MSLSMKAIEVAKQKAETEAAKAEIAAREAAAEAAEEEDAPKPKKQFPFHVAGRQVASKGSGMRDAVSLFTDL